MWIIFKIEGGQQLFVGTDGTSTHRRDWAKEFTNEEDAKRYAYSYGWTKHGYIVIEE